MLAIASWDWQTLQPLRAYFSVLAAIYLASELLYRVSQSAQWQQWFHYAGATFSVTMFGEQSIRLAITGVLLVVALVVFRVSLPALVAGLLITQMTMITLWLMRALRSLD